MRQWRYVVAAAAVAAIHGVCGGSAWAADSGRAQATLLFFSGTDLWRQGGFVHGGLLWSPGGLDSDGFTLKAVISGGSYRYLSGALGNATVTGHELTAQLMPGWRFKRDGFEGKIFAGLDLQNHRLSPDDPGSGLRGGDVGLRAGFDLWFEPSPTTMMAADGAVSTIATSYSARAAVGWRALDGFYAGPETQAFASDGYRQLRFGLHVTSLKTGLFEWTGAAGFARDSDHHTGAYVRLGLLTRR